ncbi:MAG: hypothetical protein CL927_12785 [Deltaproteobacteria bacterium]|nr:hypothetical protein [Deltaproteobacteria bacterium]HCH63736.1 hypothetical protein [Deltaproteobacteria bacterium]
MPSSFRWREHLLGLFVLYHLGAVLAGSVPAAVGGLSRRSWQNPTVAAELDAWHRTLRELGLRADRDAFEDGLYKVAVRTVRFRKQLTTPFQPYYTFAGTKQDWRMFVAPLTRPASLRIEARHSSDSEWFPLYVHHSAEHDWLAPQLRYARTRPVLFRLAWPRYKPEYRRFGRFLSRRALEADASLSAVQVVWERRRSPTPNRRKIQPIERQRPLVFERSEATE